MNALEKKIKKIVEPLFKKNPSIKQAWAYLHDLDDSCFDIEGDHGINDTHWNQMFDDEVVEAQNILSELEKRCKAPKFLAIRSEALAKIADFKTLVEKCKKEEMLDLSNSFWEAVDKDINALTSIVKKAYPWRYIDALYLEIKREGSSINVRVYEYKNDEGIIDYEEEK